jgi:hypothetical protein
MAERPELNGKRVKKANDQKVYLIIDGKRSWIPNADIYEAMFDGWDSVETIEIDEIDEGPALDDAYLVQDSEDDRTYLVASGSKRFIASANAVERYGFAKAKARPAAPGELAAMADGPEIS